jgi:hypothetical protein
MTIRSWAGAGMLALAGVLLCGAAGPAMAGGTPPASSNIKSTTSSSYPFSLRGNLVIVGTGSGESQCLYCDVGSACQCIFVASGSSSYWSWATNPYSLIGFEAELDYFQSGVDNGTGGFCSPAIGGITVDGTFSPNVLNAATYGTLCDVQSGATYTGTYLINGGAGQLSNASGSGALTAGIDENAFTTLTSASKAPIDGQIQMTGNIGFNKGVTACGTGSASNC